MSFLRKTYEKTKDSFRISNLTTAISVFYLFYLERRCGKRFESLLIELRGSSRTVECLEKPGRSLAALRIRSRSRRDYQSVPLATAGGFHSFPIGKIILKKPSKTGLGITEITLWLVGLDGAGDDFDSGARSVKLTT